MPDKSDTSVKEISAWAIPHQARTVIVTTALVCIIIPALTKGSAKRRAIHHATRQPAAHTSDSFAAARTAHNEKNQSR
jgi:hypothetical protein